MVVGDRDWLRIMLLDWSVMGEENEKIFYVPSILIIRIVNMLLKGQEAEIARFLLIAAGKCL
jgi:hypothetical protein